MEVFKQANRAILIVLLIGLLFGHSSYLVSGQADDSEWLTPINLSHSGTGTKPYIVMEGNQQFHILWQDMLEESFVYTRGNEGEWSEPLSVELPFGTRSYFPQLNVNEPTPLFEPQLVADSAGFIHAFWLGEESELFQSFVPTEGFADFGSWIVPRSLGQDVVKFEVLTGTNGQLHLAYITNTDTPEAPAGLYYRRSIDSGESWSEPTELYQSPYFRLLTSDNAHINMSLDISDLYISWDNRPRERVFLIHSQNNGTIWGTPVEIDRRQEDDSSEDVSPRNILVANYNSQLHVTWQAGHEGNNCNQIHQWSEDEGATWHTDPNFWNEFQGCPNSVEFLPGDAGLFMLTDVADAKYLYVWSESEWYEPQLQPELTSFVDEDVFRSVTYNCGQTVVLDGSQLVVVSCGQGTGQDIWLTSRSLTSLVESLQVAPVWSAPVPLESGSELISAPSLVVDDENILHLFWQQANETGNGSAIYYSSWDGLNWSRPTAVLTSPNNRVEQPSVVLSPDGNLLAVWSNGVVGEIYFSRAAVEQARIASTWSEPISLPTVRSAASTPKIVIGSEGVFHVVYAITLNEDRGVYMVSSQDKGASWSEPDLIFDAVASGWDMVDKPKLYVTDEGVKHLLWLRRPLSDNNNDSSLLYYMRSQGEESNWSEPEEIHSLSQQTTAVMWHQITGYGERVVHRSWQEQENGRTSLWHQQSLDNGLTWNQPFRVDESSNMSSAQLALDIIGQAHIVVGKTEENINNTESGILNQWVWQVDRWQREESLNLAQLPVLRTNNLAVAAMGDGRLAVVYTAQPEEEALPELIWFTQRALPIVELAPTPLPTLTPTPAPTETPQPTASPEPTPEIIFPVEPGSNAPSLPVIGTLSGNKIIIVGAILAGIPIGLVSVLVLIRRARSNRY